MKGLTRQRDEMEGMSFYQAPSSPKYRNANGFYLYFGKSDKGNTTPLRLAVQYYAESWLFIEKLWAKADGQTIQLPRLSGRSTWKRDNGSGHIWEWADVPVMDATEIAAMRRIAEAKSVTLRFEGNQYYKDSKLSDQQLKAMRDMIAAYEAVSGKPWK